MNIVYLPAWVTSLCRFLFGFGSYFCRYFCFRSRYVFCVSCRIIELVVHFTIIFHLNFLFMFRLHLSGAGNTRFWFVQFQKMPVFPGCQAPCYLQASITAVWGGRTPHPLATISATEQSRTALVNRAALEPALYRQAYASALLSTQPAQPLEFREHLPGIYQFRHLLICRLLRDRLTITPMETNYCKIFKNARYFPGLVSQLLVVFLSPCYRLTSPSRLPGR